MYANAVQAWSSVVIGSAHDGGALFGAPAITSVSVNYPGNSITIFGSQLLGTFSSGVFSVTLGHVDLIPQQASAGSIVATFPASSPPSSFFLGSYLLTVVFRHGDDPDTSATGQATFQVAKFGRKTNTKLLFNFVTNALGSDTVIEISNPSRESLNGPGIDGRCTLTYFGLNAPNPFTTPDLTGGAHYINRLSFLAPGFLGYIIADCGFPAQGIVFLEDAVQKFLTPAAAIVLNQ